MLFENMDFFNVAEIRQEKYSCGLKLLRYPGDISNNLDTQPDANERGAYVAQQASGIEIRFVTAAKTVQIALSAADREQDIVVMKGDFVHSKHTIKAGIITNLILEDRGIFKELYDKTRSDYTYSPDMWRICLGRQITYFHGIDTFGHEIRPPKPSEYPSLNWLAYGSSITQGEGAFVYTDSYVAQTARFAGVNAINIGLGGACRCENIAADFIAEREDWDIATFEVGVNMFNYFTPEEYRERLTYLVSTVIRKYPCKPIALITIYPNSQTYVSVENECTRREVAYNEIMRDIVKSFNHPNLYLIEGKDMLTDFTGLTCDLVHPNNYGHGLIARNLSKEIKKMIEAL